MNDPYKTPESTLLSEQDSDSPQLASRWRRFFAAFIDAIIGMLIAVPFWMATGLWSDMAHGVQPSLALQLLGGLYGFIGFIIVHYYLLNKNGQTVGKKLLGIRIEGIEGDMKGGTSLVTKRYLPITAASLVPVVGGILVLVDACFIFRGDKRCVHDLIAGTRVVNN